MTIYEKLKETVNEEMMTDEFLTSCDIKAQDIEAAKEIINKNKNPFIKIFMEGMNTLESYDSVIETLIDSGFSDDDSITLGEVKELIIMAHNNMNRISETFGFSKAEIVESIKQIEQFYKISGDSVC